MVFLDLPIPHPMSERSQSQQHFVIEEDGGSEYGENGGADESSIKETNSNSSFSLFRTHFRLTYIIAFQCFMIVGLVISLAVFIFLYKDTFPPYEICRTKSCTRTATLFIKTMDDTIDPCEDFHQFACGNWISDTATVVSVPMYDHTTIMRDRIIGRLRSITENITQDDIDVLQQIRAMYGSCIDTDKIDDGGFQPLVDFVLKFIPFNNNHNSNNNGSTSSDSASSATDGPSIAKILGLIRRLTGQNYILSLDVGPDYMNTSYNAILIDQPDVTLTKDNFDDDQMDTSILSDYEKLMTDVLTRLRTKVAGANSSLFTEMAASVKTIIDYDKKFAMALTDDEYRSKPMMNNLMTLHQLNLIFSGSSENGADTHENGANENVLMFRASRDADSSSSSSSAKRKGKPATIHHLHFNWTEYFNTIFDGIASFDESSSVIVNDLPYMHALASLLSKANRKELEMYLAWQLIYSLGKDVSSDIRQLLDAFTMKLDGDESRPNRRTQCITLLDKTIPFALTHKYILKYVNHSIIDETKEIARNIIRSFKDMVSQLDWMDENTIARAILKANHVRAFIGYPDWITDPSAVQSYYTGLKFGDLFFENMIVLLQWLSLKDLKTYGQLVDTTWSSDTDSPAEADAFYDDELNAITFPSGFLQNPFVGMGLKAIDYGALGSVVGHELTHGFDTEGRYSDEYGRLDSWWSMDTLQNFLGKAECFANQYDKYRIPEVTNLLGKSNNVNGRRTLAENIADNGGIREALQAYRYYIADHGSVPEPRLPGLEKYTPEQLFFLAFAQSWCSYMNPTSLANMLQSNVHSPARYRIIGPLSNFKEFSDIWSCKAESRMNPSHKCVLW